MSILSINASGIAESISVGGSGTGTAIVNGTVGSVLFVGAAGQLQQDNTNLFYDDTNNRLGVGNPTPNSVLEISGTSATTDFRISRTVSQATYFSITAPGGSPATTILGVTGVDVMSLNSSGNVGIGTASPNANAILDLTSTTKAFMPPRMTGTQRDAIASPTAGMVIYNSTTNKLNVYTTVWEAVTSA